MLLLRVEPPFDEDRKRYEPVAVDAVIHGAAPGPDGLVRFVGHPEPHGQPADLPLLGPRPRAVPDAGRGDGFVTGESGMGDPRLQSFVGNRIGQVEVGVDDLLEDRSAVSEQLRLQQQSGLAVGGEPVSVAVPILRPDVDHGRFTVRDALDAATRQGIVLGDARTDCRLRTGQGRQVQVEGTPLRDDHGLVVGKDADDLAPVANDLPGRAREGDEPLPAPARIRAVDDLHRLDQRAAAIDERAHVVERARRAHHPIEPAAGLRVLIGRGRRGACRAQRRKQRRSRQTHRPRPAPGRAARRGRRGGFQCQSPAPDW